MFATASVASAPLAKFYRYHENMRTPCTPRQNTLYDAIKLAHTMYHIRYNYLKQSQEHLATLIKTDSNPFTERYRYLERAVQTNQGYIDEAAEVFSAALCAYSNYTNYFLGIESVPSNTIATLAIVTGAAKLFAIPSYDYQNWEYNICKALFVTACTVVALPEEEAKPGLASTAPVTSLESHPDLYGLGV
jgi:hypothetical protein